MADDNIKNVGFAIITPTEDMMEQDAFEVLGRELTSEDWEDVLPEDIGTIEMNSLGYLQRVIHNARDEGHDENDLIGTAWYDASNKEQTDFVMERSEHADNAESEYDPKGELYKGLSDIGQSLLADRVRFEFFDVPDEDYEEWEDSQ